MCRVKLIGASGARVYGIAFPRPDGSIKRKCWDVAVKVTDDEDAFKNEVRALQAVLNNGYYQSHWSCCDAEPLEAAVGALTVTPCTERWWDKSHLKGAAFHYQGGAIFMRVADLKMLPNVHHLQEIVDGVLISLREMHQQNIVHCDIRKANIRLL